MAIKDGERSASSATRFTATTPHASSKTGSGAAIPKPRFSPAQGAGGPMKPAAVAGGPIPHGETPEQRVARLRAAHEAAKNAKVSMFDTIIAKSRPLFDSAHRITVMSLVGLTAVAGLMTAYTAYDMLRYNRKRKVEFLEAQRKMSADSLEAARLAYMRGDATVEQVTLVDEANARAAGDDGQGFKLPSILSSPQAIRRDDDSGSAPSTEDVSSGAQSEENRSSKLFGWFSSRSNKEEDRGNVAAGARSSDAPLSLQDKRAMLEKARAAFDKEKEDQRNGGPLDRVGIEESATDSTQPRNTEQPRKKGWWW